jgi:hypothetical protein
MNKYQRLVIIAAVINTLIMLCFPPFLSQPLARGTMPGFDGFYPLSALFSGKPLFKELFTLQLMLVGINMLSAWLALSGKTRQGGTPKFSIVHGIGWFSLINLLLIFAFPPFESHRTLLYGTSGGFDGFYFIFENNFRRTIFWPLLYIECSFIVINALALLLLFSAIRNASDKQEFAAADTALKTVPLGRKSERRRHNSPPPGVERRSATDRRHEAEPENHQNDR